MSRATAFIIAVATLLADQLSKEVVRARVQDFDTIVVIPGCLNIIRSANSGIAFGILSDSSSGWTKMILIVVGIAVMGIIGRLLWKTSGVAGQGRLTAALALVMGGAAGNLLDRIVHGEVTDFIDFYVGRFHWYTFNVADAAITVAAALLVLDIFSSRGASNSAE
jgi:signal peptidase II